MTDLEEIFWKRKNYIHAYGGSTLINIFYLGQGKGSLNNQQKQLMHFIPLSYSLRNDQKKMSILDVYVRLRNWSLETDLHIKPTGIIQFLDSTSCQSYHCKKSLPYSQILSSRRIYSDVETFDQSCYGLKKWIKGRGYGE